MQRPRKEYRIEERTPERREKSQDREWKQREREERRERRREREWRWGSRWLFSLLISFLWLRARGLFPLRRRLFTCLSFIFLPWLGRIDFGKDTLRICLFAESERKIYTMRDIYDTPADLAILSNVMDIMDKNCCVTSILNTTWKVLPERRSQALASGREKKPVATYLGKNDDFIDGTTLI
jgi:hypothetical protein